MILRWKTVFPERIKNGLTVLKAKSEIQVQKATKEKREIPEKTEKMEKTEPTACPRIKYIASIILNIRVAKKIG